MPHVPQAVVCALLLLLWARGAAAVVEPASITSADERLFPRPQIVRKQIRFWEKVFSKYPSSTVIVHEAFDPDRIIDLIDYKTFVPADGEARPVPRKERDQVTLKYIKRYNKAIERFVREKEGALRHGPIEKRLYKVYKNDPKSLEKLFSGQLKLRAQTGLADDFRQAAPVARAWLPYMEKVFRQYGVPTRITRLAFVESMFNLKARSKVGASGIWQFMPATARNFIYVNSLVDERNAPFKATRAAAQLLLNNYNDLRSWPLAITAYNHGNLGMQRAVKQVGTDDIGEIIKKYDSKSFGFASRNFYAEVMAAANVYEKLIRSGKITTTISLPETDRIILKEPVSVKDLIQKTPLTQEVLASLNPCILESTFTKNAAVPLPPYFELHVPRPSAHLIRTALANIDRSKYARR